MAKSQVQTVTNQSEDWESESVLNNLRFIRQARESRGEDTTWMIEIEDELYKASKKDNKIM
jgi:hypothetical protein